MAALGKPAATPTVVSDSSQPSGNDVAPGPVVVPTAPPATLPPPTLAPPSQPPVAPPPLPTVEVTPTDAPTLVPTMAPPPTVPVPEPTIVKTPTPTPIPAPSVRCEREGPNIPVEVGHALGYRCTYTRGPLKAVVLALPAGWQYTWSGDSAIWYDSPSVDSPTYEGEAGEVRLYLRASQHALPGSGGVAVVFRAAGSRVDGPATEMHLPVALQVPTPTSPAVEETPESSEPPSVVEPTEADVPEPPFDEASTPIAEPTPTISAPADPIATPAPAETEPPAVAPSVQCQREGEDVPVAAGHTVAFRCDYSRGPLMPIVDAVPADWHYRWSVEDAAREDPVEQESPVFVEETGTIGIVFRSGEYVEADSVEVSISFRAPDYSEAAPASEVVLTIPVTAPVPTTEPHKAFDPTLDCTVLESAIAGSSDWAYQECVISWESENVRAIEASASTTTEGWSVIAVDAPVSDEVGPQAIPDGPLMLVDRAPEDEGFHSSRLLLGTKLECDAQTTSSIDLELVAAFGDPEKEAAGGEPTDQRAGQAGAERVSRALVAKATTPAAPNVSLASASFTPIDLADERQVSTGTFDFAWTGAPEGCRWQVTAELGDFANDESKIPAANLEFVRIEGLDASVTQPTAGTFVIQANTSQGTSTGVFTLTTDLALDGFTPQGSYATTVSLDVVMDP